MNSEPTNAVAGPSTSRPSPSASSSTSQLFLPPPGPPPSHPTYLSSTQDLLARFHLLPAYDKYVRPFATPVDIGPIQVGVTPITPAANASVDKGKGKEVESVQVSSEAPDGAEAGDDEGGKGEKKKRNNYKHLIKGIPGKHSMKKDDYLSTMIQVPPKQRIQITPFDLKTQQEAFAVSLEGLKGWNPNALVLESAQAREDRKRRKEAKRLQKLQLQAALAATVAQPQPIQAPVPTAATSPSFHRPPPNQVSSGTPRPGSAAPVQRPGSAVPRPGSVAAKPVIARPGSVVPRSGSVAPRPGSTKPTVPPVQVPSGRVGTPLRTGTPLRSASTVTPTSANPYQLSNDPEKRGIKRERDDTVGLPLAVNGHSVPNSNGNLAHANTPRPVLNAKAGTAGIRPRPLKKQRMDVQGQARDVVLTQQPTPQGV